MLVVAYTLAAIVLLIVNERYSTASNIRFGSDYVLYYATSQVLHEHSPKDVYAITILDAYESKAAGVAMGQALPMIYPPPFLFFALPLRLLPFPASLLAFLCVTTGLFYVTLARFGPVGLPLPLPLLVFSFPAVFAAIVNGQNGLLTGAFLGGALLLAGRRDVWSGLCLGLAFYKPHLALPALVALAAGGHRAAVVTCLGTVFGLYAGSLAVFGIGTWQAFFDNARLAQQLLSGEAFPLAKMMSAYAAARGLGCPNAVAMAVQIVVSVAALGAVAFVWRSPADRCLRVAVASVCILLFPYYSFGYDWVVLLVGLACLFSYAQRTGLAFSAWEKGVIGLAYVSPLLAFALSVKTGVQIAPFALCSLLWVLLRFVRSERRAGQWPTAAAGPLTGSGPAVR
ncbi:hypothetical protein NY78_4166 [Desulfovibrio sp. TomC]|nr:hypothetical protein NY78_4166 [Desulfovibrio sp. TomC]